MSSSPTAQSAGSGGFQWITGNKPDDFKTKHVMQKVRQTAMGSYLQGARSQASNKSRSNSEASDKSQSSVGDQGATKPRPTKTPKGKGKTDSEKKGLVPNKQLQPNSNVQGTSDPASQVARQSTLPRRSIVVPIMDNMRGYYPFDLYPVPELYSLGKGLDPFGTMFQSRDARVNVEGLKFQCASYFGTEGLGKYWIPLCLSYPHAFLSTLYMASAFKDVIENSRVESLETAALRQDVIHFVSEHLTNREQCVADHNIIAVSQLILGNVITRMDAGLTFHQNGIETMIRQRGGLSKLGVHGQLASAVSWANLAIAILREKEPTQMYVEYCTIHSAKKYARDIVIPESPLYRPHDRYVTLANSTKCTPRARKLLDEVQAMVELFIESQHSNRQSNASKLRNFYHSINQYPPGSRGDGWRYEAIRLTARVQAQAIIDQVPLSEALKRVQSSETQPTMYSSSIASRSNDSISSTLEFQQVTPVTESSESPNFAPYNGMNPQQQVGFPFNHRDSTSSTYSQRPSPLSIQSSSSAISPQLWISTSTSGRSTILQQLRDALEKSDLSECWSDMAGVLLWIGLVMGAASNENEDKVLARYFSATTMRACIMLCFEHPEAVHSTMLKMTDIVGALNKRPVDAQLARKDSGISRKRAKA